MAGRAQQRLEVALKAWIKEALGTNRYRHTLGVVDAAERLAAVNGVDIEKARLAGLLHDYARDLPGDRLLELAGGFSLEISTADRRNPCLLHGPVAACLAEREFALQDSEILRAVYLHTTGGPRMTVLDKVVYLADCIEPGRDFPGADELRTLACEDLDAAVRSAMELSIGHVLRHRGFLHPRTVDAWNDLLDGDGNQKPRLIVK